MKTEMKIRSARNRTNRPSEKLKQFGFHLKENHYSINSQRSADSLIEDST